MLGIIALIFIGPNQLPEVARTVGRMLNELKRATGDLQETFTANLTKDVNERWEDTRHKAAQEHERESGQLQPPENHFTAASEGEVVGPHDAHDEFGNVIRVEGNAPVMPTKKPGESGDQT